MIKRRKSKIISVGKVKIGGNKPIVIQGMTKISTEKNCSCSCSDKRNGESWL